MHVDKERPGRISSTGKHALVVQHLDKPVWLKPAMCSCHRHAAPKQVAGRMCAHHCWRMHALPVTPTWRPAVYMHGYEPVRGAQLHLQLPDQAALQHTHARGLTCGKGDEQWGPKAARRLRRGADQRHGLEWIVAAADVAGAHTAGTIHRTQWLT